MKKQLTSTMEINSGETSRKRKNSKANTKINKKKSKIEIEDVEKHEKKTTDIATTITESKWRNKTRVLVFSSRGISYPQRQLMLNIRSILPHSKSETKMERRVSHYIINEMCEMKNCNKCIFFESRRKSDLYMWISNASTGPSAKFVVENIHAMSELRLTGNCLKGSRPLLSFDKNFETSPHWLLLKELFTQVFGVPNYHPKSKPFVDHVMTFTISRNRIWIRNYQIVEENGELVEIGPRFTLNPSKIFKGSFSGETLYDNPQFVTPSATRRMLKMRQGDELRNQAEAKIDRDLRKPDYSVFEDDVNKIFEENCA